MSPHFGLWSLADPGIKGSGGHATTLFLRMLRGVWFGSCCVYFLTFSFFVVFVMGRSVIYGPLSRNEKAAGVPRSGQIHDVNTTHYHKVHKIAT
jgi:hypothetical protein